MPSRRRSRNWRHTRRPRRQGTEEEERAEEEGEAGEEKELNQGETKGRTSKITGNRDRRKKERPPKTEKDKATKMIKRREDQGTQ